MSVDEQQDVSNQISIEDLEASLQVYEIQSDQKLQKLKQLFQQKQTLDLRQNFYEDRSSLQVKFQNIVGDLTQFLINQQVPSTEKLRKTFYRILQSPLLLLFKVSRFQIFNLRLNAFDIQLEPIQAISELASLLYKNIDQYVSMQTAQKTDFTGSSSYQSFNKFLQHAKINLIFDQIFILYSYLRKGSNILKKKMEEKLKVIQIFNKMEEKLINTLLKNEDVKTIKQLSILNYEIYLLQNNFDVICFYLKVPFYQIYQDIFKELQILTSKAKLTCNYDMFILIFIKFNNQIIAKINQQGIDACYAVYIQNILITLLELWGCRVCQYKQFYTFFKTLFYIHPNQKKLLQTCLKHNPNLSKQDISLIRANIRQNVQNKKSQLLCLLKQQNLQEINGQLNHIYHRVLYNLDFNQQTKEQIVQLLTLINGNSNIQEFFNTSQKAFKSWNHTIDFISQHKFIQSQFKFPNNLSNSQILQSFRIFTNLCILQEKGFDKQFLNLVTKGTINKALIGLCKFTLTNEQVKVYIKKNSLLSQFILQSLKFLQKTLPPSSKQWQLLLSTLTTSLKLIQKAQIKNQIQKRIQQYTIKNIEHFELGRFIYIFKQLYSSNSNSNYLNTNVKIVTDILMKDCLDKSKEIYMFRFFDQQIKSISNQKISSKEVQFLKKYAQVHNGFIQVKDISCFKLSQLQVITNPIQFQKAMDNYYFGLDSNSKRYVQFIAELWAKSMEQKSESIFYSNLLINLLKFHPISIPILCNIRITNKQKSQQFRFIEFLINKYACTQISYQIRQVIKQILELIMNCNQIKYRNGKDYIIEEIVPMVLKRVLTIINDKNSNFSTQIYLLLSICLNKTKLTQIKIQTIQKSILKINYQINQSKCQKITNKLSQCAHSIIRIFFKKKQIQIKKVGLLQIFENIVWNQIRTFNINTSNTTKSKQLNQNIIINDQIMVSPYTLSQQYNLEQYKIKKGDISIGQIQKNNKQTQQNIVAFSSIIQSLSKKQSQVSYSASNIPLNGSQAQRQIDLSKMVYSIPFHLGQQNLQYLQLKQNISIKQKHENAAVKQSKQNMQKSITFVQYYLREMSYPQVSEDIAIRTILSNFKKQIKISYIWTNANNLQKIFVPLVILFQIATSNKKINPQLIKNLPNYWQDLLTLALNQSTQIIKNILSVFSQFGYNNLWGENYKTLNLYQDVRKTLQIKEIQDQSFLSIVLKKSLQYQLIAQIESQINEFLDKVFSSRPQDQTCLMYKVGIDKNLLNLIMKSLQIQNLKNISFLFHSNFSNLRLYTDQLHQGLKSLNMSSKTRSFNQYIILSSQTNDEQFIGPMKLFQQNFKFFIKIQKQGYHFKKLQQQKLTIQRLFNKLRQYQDNNKHIISKECDQIIKEYLLEIQKLQITIANRVKAFYLVTKLRDLAYQNSITISLVREILKAKNIKTTQILNQIKKIQIFTLLMTLYKQLVLFDNDWQNQQYYQKYHQIDQKTIQKDLTICTTRRFSHSMNKVYQKCDLELDQIIQRCVDQMKFFFTSDQGKNFIEQNTSIFYPAFFIKSFASPNAKFSSSLPQKIKKMLQFTRQTISPITIQKQQVSQFRQMQKKQFYSSQNKILFTLQNKAALKIKDFLSHTVNRLISNQTLLWTKSTNDEKFLIFNKYKTSEPTLEDIQLLGYLVAHCLYHKIQLKNGNQEILPLHNSIISAICFNLADIDDLLDFDFKIWEDLKRILTIQDSKTENLNFSYIFENLKTLQPQRVQLIDKGSSKKVNNQNREQFSDSIACHMLYKNFIPQLTRFLSAILYFIPKQFLSCSPISQIYSIFYKKAKYELIMKKYLRKIGKVTPQIIFKNGNKIDNLKDYQNVQWVEEILFENNDLRHKIWKDQTNLFITTSIANTGKLEFHHQSLLVHHFQSKQEMLDAFKKL